MWLPPLSPTTCLPPLGAPRRLDRAIRMTQKDATVEQAVDVLSSLLPDA
jgi:hypothetical protein